MESNGIQWNPMHAYVILWNLMESYEILWNPIDLYEIQLSGGINIMNIYEYHGISMNIKKYTLNINEYEGISMIINADQWIFMKINECAWIYLWYQWILSNKSRGPLIYYRI